MGVAQEEEGQQQRQDAVAISVADQADPAEHARTRRVPPNFVEQFLRVRGEVVERGPGGPEVVDDATAPASFSEATIWSPVSISAVTTMYPAPPTTATSARTGQPGGQRPVDPALDEPRWTGPSSAVPSRASSTGVTAVLSSTHSQIATAADPGDQQDDGAPGGQPPGAVGQRGLRSRHPPTRSRCAAATGPARRHRTGDGAVPKDAGRDRDAAIAHMPWTAGTVPRRPAWKSSKACLSSAWVFITNGP